MCCHDFYWRTVQEVEIPLQPFHVIGHDHSGEAITHDHVAAMFLRWVFPDPSAAEQFFEAIGLGAIVVTGKSGYE